MPRQQGCSWARYFILHLEDRLVLEPRMERSLALRCPELRDVLVGYFWHTHARTTRTAASTLSRQQRRDELTETTRMHADMHANMRAKVTDTLRRRIYTPLQRNEHVTNIGIIDIHILAHIIDTNMIHMGIIQ